MARKVRKSAEDEETDEVVDMINNTANLSPRRSPRKRKADIDDIQGSPKRTKLSEGTEALSQAAANPAGTPRRSGRLSGRQPIAEKIPVNRKDMWELPPDGGDKEEAGLLQPGSKTRNLRKRPSPNPSPLKNFGIVDTSTNSNVDLEDSQMKQRVSRKPKVSKNLCSGVKESNAEDRTAMPVRQTEQTETRTSKTLSKQHPRNETIQKSAETVGAQTIRRIENDKVQTRSTSNTVHNPAAQEKPTVDRETLRANIDGEETEENPIEVNESNERVREFFGVYGRADDYLKMMVAAAKIETFRKDRSIVSFQCKRFQERIMQSGTTSAKPIKEQFESLQKLRRSLDDGEEALDKEFANSSTSKESFAKQLVRDYSLNLIPDAISHLNLILSSHGDKHGFDLTACNNLLTMLSIVSDMIQIVDKWKMQSGNLSKTLEKAMILIKKMSKNVESLAEPFETEAERLQGQIKDENLREALKKSQQQHWQHVMSELGRRRAEVRERHRSENQAVFSAPGYGVSGIAFPGEKGALEPFEQVIDIDDNDFGVLDHTTQPSRFERNSFDDLSQRQKPSHSRYEQKPRLVRENTEEIPVPRQGNWSDQEYQALLNGLQMFTSANRFEDILDLYGGKGDVLARRDLDELMDQAQFIKESMARHLRVEFDSSWNWLRSVP